MTKNRESIFELTELKIFVLDSIFKIKNQLEEAFKRSEPKYYPMDSPADEQYIYELDMIINTVDRKYLLNAEIEKKNR